MTVRVPASGPKNAKLAIVGIAPASEEVATGIPFMGAAGRILNTALKDHGISREQVYVTNLLTFPIKVGLPAEAQVSAAQLKQETERLKIELMSVNPNVIMPLGAEPLRAVCGLDSITKWRGSILNSTLIPDTKCVPSVHPAWIIRGMWKWLPVFTHIDVKRALAQSASPDIKLPTRSMLTGPSFKTVLDFLGACHGKPYICFDIETAYWSKSRPGEIACFGIGYSPDEALCIPFMWGNGKPYWNAREESLIWRTLAHVLQSNRGALVGQNLSFEYIYMWLHGIYPARPAIDTMLLHHCLYPDWGSTENVGMAKRGFDEPGHGLAFINSQYTETPYYKDDGKTWNPQLGDHGLWRYNCLDVMCTLDAALAMRREAHEEKQWDFYNKMYIRPFLHASRMEWFGTPIDTELRTVVGAETDKRITELQRELDTLVGKPFNVNSPKQVSEFLYQERGYQARTKFDKKSGKSKVTADRAALEFFAIKNEDRTLNVMIELRKLMDMRSDVINAPLDSQGYIHTHYKIGGTDSGRWSSTRSILGSGGNLQNIPRDGIARRLFVSR